MFRSGVLNNNYYVDYDDDLERILLCVRVFKHHCNCKEAGYVKVVLESWVVYRVH